MMMANNFPEDVSYIPIRTLKILSTLFDQSVIAFGSMNKNSAITILEQVRMNGFQLTSQHAKT